MPNRTKALSSSGRAIAIIAAHVLLIYLLATSMGVVKLPNFAKPMEAVMIDQPEVTKSEPVKVIKPDLTQPTVEQPPLDTVPPIDVPLDEPVAQNAITAATSDAVETADMKVTNRVDPLYPPQSRRLGEHGSGVFKVLVGENGRPVEVSVVQSSGFARLDQAAMDAIRRWVFKPAVQNSQPVRSWTKVQVTFRLEG